MVGEASDGPLMKQNERTYGMLDMMPTMQRWLSNQVVRVGLPMFVSPFLDWQSVFSKLVQTSTHQTSRYPSLAMWGTETSTYFLIDPANEAEDLKQFQQLNDRLIERALKM